MLLFRMYLFIYIRTKWGANGIKIRENVIICVWRIYNTPRTKSYEIDILNKYILYAETLRHNSNFG